MSEKVLTNAAHLELEEVEGNWTRSSEVFSPLF